MTEFIQNIIWNSVEGFVEAGTRTVGEYAGNALISVGDMIENGGRSMGNGIERRATSYGTSISGQTYKPSPKPLPSTARKPAIKRSNSLPASTKPSTGTSQAPLGPNKRAGQNQAAKAVLGAKSSASGGGATRSIPPFKGPTASTTGAKSQSKPYSNSNNLPKPYKSYPSSEKKTAVRPGQLKPFVPPVENKTTEKKPYPGTNTLPGQGSRKPVKAKPPPRLGPQVAPGQKMQHLAI